MVQGGEGGKSKIKFTMDQNVEYIITGLYGMKVIKIAPFVYRKANLIAVVGEGGDGGTNGIMVVMVAVSICWW